MRRKNKKRLYTFLITFLILDLIVIFNVLNVSNARYESDAVSETELDVALFAISEDDDYYITLDTMVPREDPYVYKFEITNTDKNGTLTDVKMKYNLRIITTTNLPLEYELYKNQNYLSSNAENIITPEQDVIIPDPDGTFFRVMTTPEEEFGFNQANLRANLQKIIDTEGPVSYNIIKKYINDATKSLAKIGPKADKFIKTELDLLFVNKTFDLDDKGKPIDFYWPKNMNYILSFFRISDRDIIDIPKEEIAACMKQILKMQGTMSLNDLFKATLEVFKYGDAILNNKNRNKLMQAYKFGFEKGFLEALE